MNPAALHAYQQENWETAASLLENSPPGTENQRLLALAYFNAQDVDAALPALRQSAESHPDDPEILGALIELLIAERLFAEAESHAAAIEAAGRPHEARFGRARIEAGRGQPNAAIPLLDALIEEAPGELAQSAADLLVEILLSDNKAGQAYEVAQRAIAKDPDSFYAFRFDKLQAADDDDSPGLRYILGYRMEYDDNVALLPDSNPGIFGTSGEEDLRHVLTAEVLYRRSFVNSWSVFAEGRLSQSFHQDLDPFDLGTVNVLAGFGQARDRWGWRLPVEVVHDRYDGHSFRTSVRVTPGIYFRLGSKLFLHLYGWKQDDDFDRFTGPVDSRSGDVDGGGLLLAGQLTPRFRLHSFIETADYETEGSNWQREESSAYVYGEFSFRQHWLAGLAVRYREIDYDRLRLPFLDFQSDESREIYLSLARQLPGEWQIKAQLTQISHESNNPVFNHDRDVISISIGKVF